MPLAQDNSSMYLFGPEDVGITPLPLRVENQQLREERDKLASQVKQLREALDVVPAALMLAAGGPYTVTFSWSALERIEQALAETELPSRKTAEEI